MQNNSHQKFNNLIDAYILMTAFLLITFVKAIFSILELFTYGIFKKEILTESSKLGFDIKIKM
tara:strand:+ start:39 stop:227 length:189 start_codon:yes stop_codon:yes gene_type:complete